MLSPRPLPPVGAGVRAENGSGICDEEAGKTKEGKGNEPGMNSFGLMTDSGFEDVAEDP